MIRTALDRLQRDTGTSGRARRATSGSVAAAGRTHRPSTTVPVLSPYTHRNPEPHCSRPLYQLSPVLHQVSVTAALLPQALFHRYLGTCDSAPPATRLPFMYHREAVTCDTYSLLGQPGGMDGRDMPNLRRVAMGPRHRPRIGRWSSRQVRSTFSASARLCNSPPPQSLLRPPRPLLQLDPRALLPSLPALRL